MRCNQTEHNQNYESLFLIINYIKFVFNLFQKAQPIASRSYDKQKALSKSELSSIVFTK